MKRSTNHPAERTTAARTMGRILLVWSLSLCLDPPIRADVIDDFGGGRKFIMHGDANHPDWQLAGGQLQVTMPEIEAYGAFYYLRDYQLKLGRPMEFRVDLRSLAPGDGYAGLAVLFTGAPFLPKGGDRGYILYRQHDKFLLYELWDDTATLWRAPAAPPMSQPETMSLILTREGTTMRVEARVVLSDDASTVRLLETVTDRSPPTTPVAAVLINCGSISNPSAVVFDNLACSGTPTPLRAGIQRQGGAETALGLPGFTIPQHAAAVDGPWTACVAALSQEAGGRCATMACDGSERFFRLVHGRHVIEEFNDTSGAWATASLVAGQIHRPWLAVTGGRCRIRGLGPGNEDFVMQFPLAAGLWYTDCAASVDIVDWNETMVGAAFGIYLRVDAGQDLWFPATDGMPANHYAGMLQFKPLADSDTSAISINGSGDTALVTKQFPLLDPTKRYRLQFCAAGSQLTLALFDLDHLDTPLATCQKRDTRFPKGLAALGGRRSRAGNELYDVTIDRFLLNGAMPGP